MREKFKNEDLGRVIDSKPYKTKYLRTPEERDEYQVRLSGGEWVSSKTHPIEMGKTYIFVMDGKENFYLGTERKGSFHHSSFLAGAPVAAAGEITFLEDGRIRINCRSGHYQPHMDSLRQVLETFESNGIPLSKIEVDRGPRQGRNWGEDWMSGQVALQKLTARRNFFGRPENAISPP